MAAFLSVWDYINRMVFPGRLAGAFFWAMCKIQGSQFFNLKLLLTMAA